MKRVRPIVGIFAGLLFCSLISFGFTQEVSAPPVSWQANESNPRLLGSLAVQLIRQDKLTKFVGKLEVVGFGEALAQAIKQFWSGAECGASVRGIGSTTEIEGANIRVLAKFRAQQWACVKIAEPRLSGSFPPKPEIRTKLVKSLLLDIEVTASCLVSLRLSNGKLGTEPVCNPGSGQFGTFPSGSFGTPSEFIADLVRQKSNAILDQVFGDTVLTKIFPTEAIAYDPSFSKAEVTRVRDTDIAIAVEGIISDENGKVFNLLSQPLSNK